MEFCEADILNVMRVYGCTRDQAIHHLELDERARDADDEEDPDYGGGDDDRDDERSAREIAEGDRLDMGRNDAGEWIGYM